MKEDNKFKNKLLQPFIPDLPSLGRKVFILSDLHMASGLTRNGNYEGTENFYADGSFVRFIDHIQKGLKRNTAILIINGDFIDFLRICSYPSSDEEFKKWGFILSQAGITKNTEELKLSISSKEKKYGLRTNDYKSIWKLYTCSKGHYDVFCRLGEWIKAGNELVVVKGNHDLEWYWPKVQEYFRYRMAEFAAGESERIETVFLQTVSRQIYFIDEAITIDKKIYIEHGHRYENTTAVKGDPMLSHEEGLNLPFGSFFNRYLINRIEFAYPYIDNIRPAQNILPVLLRERFPLGVKLLFQYVPFLLLIIPKKLYWQTFKYLLNILFIVVLPIGITGYAIWQTVHQGTTDSPEGVLAIALSAAKNLGFRFLSYIFGRLLSMAGLKSPPTLSANALEIFKKLPSLQAVCFGHTHDPEQKELSSGKWYFNTGTWIPVFETSSANVREEKTYTFIAIDCQGPTLCTERLQRWNDDAGRIEAIRLNDKK